MWKKGGKQKRTKLPPKPAKQLNPIISKPQPQPRALHARFSIQRSKTPIRPITKPPNTETEIPNNEIPPLVPLGTLSRVRICIGWEVDKIPSSEARVSARAVEKWLRGVRDGH